MQGLFSTVIRCSAGRKENSWVVEIRKSKVRVLSPLARVACLLIGAAGGFGGVYALKFRWQAQPLGMTLGSSAFGLAARCYGSELSSATVPANLNEQLLNFRGPEDKNTLHRLGARRDLVPADPIATLLHDRFKQWHDHPTTVTGVDVKKTPLSKAQRAYIGLLSEFRMAAEALDSSARDEFSPPGWNVGLARDWNVRRSLYRIINSEKAFPGLVESGDELSSFPEKQWELVWDHAVQKTTWREFVEVLEKASSTTERKV
jgi:hypothetical protein